MDLVTTETEDAVIVAKRIFDARNTQVDHFAQLYPLLLAEMSEIMSGWDRSAEQLPWTRLEMAVRRNNLAVVVTRVIDCAMSSASKPERVRSLIDAACEHGEFRRTQNMDVESLFAEYDKIRAVTWTHLKVLVKPPTTYDAIFVIDGLLSVATRGTILGFHRAEMEEHGLWEKQLAELSKTVMS